MADSLMKLLCSSAKIERDRGVQEILLFLNETNKDQICMLEQCLNKFLNDKQSPWETKHGSLMGAKVLLKTGNCSNEFALILKNLALDMLDDGEARVRSASGENIYMT